MTLMSYYYGNYFGDYMLYMIIFGGAIFGGQFIAMALVPKLAEKHDKTRMLIGSTIMGAIPFALIYPVYLLAPRDLDQPLWVAILFVVFALAGGGIGALNVLQSVMIADCVDYEEYHNVLLRRVFYYQAVRRDQLHYSGRRLLHRGL